MKDHAGHDIEGGRTLPHTKDAVNFFHEIAADYDHQHYGTTERNYMTVRHQKVLEFVDSLTLRAGSDVLDAGCGPGWLVEALASRGFRVRAMDAAEAMLVAARARLERAAPATAVEFTQGDIERLPYPDATFDLVCSTGVIEYLASDEKVLKEMHRVLRPGGHLVLPVTNAFAVANWLEFFIEGFKRQQWLLKPFNALWTRSGRAPVHPRHFRVRFHRPAEFRAALERAGFRVSADVFFHFLPWPRPLDKFLPHATAAMERRLDRYGSSGIGVLAEGYLTLSRRD